MPYKILVVDDEPSACKALRDFLEGKGYSVVEAYSGEEALVAYRRESPDIMLLDIMMQGISGLDTLRELRTIDPEASVIMVTALHETELAKQAMDEGAIDYITKPIDTGYLELALMTSISLQGKNE